MKKILSFFFASLLFASATAAGEPKRAEVLAVMERAADWQIAHPAKWQAHEWHYGAFYTGVMALAVIAMFWAIAK